MPLRPQKPNEASTGIDVMPLLKKALDNLSESGDLSADMCRFAESATELPDGTWFIQFPLQYTYQRRSCEREDRKKKLEEVASEVAGKQIVMTFGLAPNQSQRSAPPTAPKPLPKVLPPKAPPKLPPKAPPQALRPSPQSPPPSSSESSINPEEVKQILAAEYDKLNKFWKETEKSFASLMLPQYVEHPYREYGDPDNEDCDVLSWQRWGSEWRLCYSWYTVHDPINRDVKPITDCSADIRVAAVKAVAPLRGKLMAKSATFLAEVKAASQVLEDFLKNK